MLTLVGIGCGSRTRTYCQLAARQPHRYRVVAGADPNPLRVGYDGHGGGDPGLVQALDQELVKPARAMRSGLHASVASHLLAFAAEEARRTGRVVDLATFHQETTK